MESRKKFTISYKNNWWEKFKKILFSFSSILVFRYSGHYLHEQSNRNRLWDNRCGSRCCQFPSVLHTKRDQQVIEFCKEYLVFFKTTRYWGLFTWMWGTPGGLGNPPSRDRKIARVYIQSHNLGMPGWSFRVFVALAFYSVRNVTIDLWVKLCRYHFMMKVK